MQLFLSWGTNYQLIKILAIAFILVGCQADNQTQVISISQVGCNFLVGSNTTAFTFILCNTSLSKLNSNWQQCMNECCSGLPQSILSPPSMNALRVCQQKQSRSQSLRTITIIIFGVLATVAVTIFISFCCIIIKVIKSVYENRAIQQNQDNQVIEWQNEQKYLTQNHNMLKWCRKTKNQLKRPFNESTCSICLDESPNAELFCQHMYHPSCIGFWLKNSNFCPLCHKENIRAIKIYCQKCHSQYLICRKGFLILNMQALLKKCVICSQDQKEISIQMQNVQQHPSQLLIFQVSSQQLASTS